MAIKTFFGPGGPGYDPAPSFKTTPPTPVRPLSVEEANKPILDITGEQALMGADTMNPATGETIPGQFDLGEAEIKPTDKTVETEELLTTTDKTLGVSDVSPDIDTAAATAAVTTPTGDVSTIDAIERTYSNMPTTTAAQGTVSTGAQIDVNQVVDERTKGEMFERGSLAEAKTQTLAAEASTKYQVEQLMASLNSGAELPPWAAPAARKVRSMMNQRGLSSSSMAAAAMVQALMESSIPIANSDAQAHANLQLQNLNNEQQTALANAATIAAMDRQNLDNRMKAAQQNASSFLQMDLANLTNRQATETLTYQSKVQSLFTDAAAANAAKQFNATTQNQVNQFYDQLGTTVENNNANREVALNEFNTDQKNSMRKFISGMEDAREKFNSNLQNLVDQSNATWRRNVNTVNNATQNAANKSNAEAILGLSVDAQNNLWQKYRDEAYQAFTASQNGQQRAHAIAIAAIANQFSMDLFAAGIDADESERTSRFFGSLLHKVIGAGMNAFTFTSDGSDTDWDEWMNDYNTYDPLSDQDPDLFDMVDDDLWIPSDTSDTWT